MRVEHFCIDMQVIEQEIFPSAIWTPLCTNIGRLTSNLAARGVPTVHVAFSLKGLFHPMPGGVGRLSDLPEHNRNILEEKPHLGFASALPPDALVAFKNVFSAYAEPDIAAYLNKRKPDLVVLSGVKARVCVMHTAIDLANAGHKVAIAADATDIGMAAHRDFTAFPNMKGNFLLHADRASIPIANKDLIGFSTIDTLVRQIGATRPASRAAADIVQCAL